MWSIAAIVAACAAATHVGLFFLVASVERLQRAIVFLNFLNFPFGDLTDLERFQVGPGRVVKLPTPDGETLVGWMLERTGPHVNGNKENKDEEYILYLHGNAANIALPHRRRLYRCLQRRGNMHLLAMDYRGFGHSTGTPSADALTIDALTMWDYLLTLAPPHRIHIVAHSLGTGVACALAEHLHKRAEQPATVTLLAPFSSLLDAIYAHFMFKPFRPFRFFRDYTESRLMHRFPSMDRIGYIRCPLLIVHGTLDVIVPHHLGRKLYHHAVSLGHNERIDYLEVKFATHSRLHHHKEVRDRLAQHLSLSKMA